ncbi:hypothetical protein VULLAG_LOCUS23035 [Vulpes lagopus]
MRSNSTEIPLPAPARRCRPGPDRRGPPGLGALAGQVPGSAGTPGTPGPGNARPRA